MNSKFWIAALLCATLLSAVPAVAANRVSVTVVDAKSDKPARPENRPLFPEYVTSGDKTLEIAAHIIRWLVAEETREGLVADLAKLVMTEGGQPREDNWFWRIVHFRRETKEVYLDSPVPITITD